jgi:NAD+ synthase (glutamine-hydrolysing)
VRFKVGLAQIAPELGSVNSNLEKHLQFIEQASQANVDLLIFPELSLTGYSLQDAAPSVALPLHSPVIQKLVQASGKMDLVFSFLEEDERYRRYVAALYLSAGQVVHRHRKVYLPTYGMFDEGRFFAPGDSIRAFDTKFGRMGLAICEDFWHVSLPYILWADGADMMVFISAQPGRGVQTKGTLLASNETVEGMLTCYAGRFTNFIFHCNRTGTEDGAWFGGNSIVIHPDGGVTARAEQFTEQLVLADIDTECQRRERISSPTLRDEKLWLTVRELERIYRAGGQE